jgi:hypothetical protein
MKGAKERNIRSLPEDISFEELVPKDNFYHRLEVKLALYFARELVEDPYADSGHPSIDPSELLKEGEGNDLRVREALYRLVAAGAWVKQSVGVVHDTEEHTQSFFQWASEWLCLRWPIRDSFR